MHEISKEIFLSISTNPGTFGETVHNAGYDYYSLNFLYKAIKTTDLKKTIEAIRLLEIKGCSVSMPFKEKVIEYVDLVDNDANNAGAINTIYNNNGVLKGFNTDIFGATKTLDVINITPKDTVLLLGAGGVSRAILIALQKRGINNIFITNRNPPKARLLSKLFNCELIEWEQRNTFKSSVMINCTPVGMRSEYFLSPLKITSLTNFDKIMDVVVNEVDTSLIKNAKKFNIPYVSGLYMTFFQAAEQFKLYTGYEAPIDHMIMAYNKKFNKSFEL